MRAAGSDGHPQIRNLGSTERSSSRRLIHSSGRLASE